jgi:hypothetical protein
MYLFHLPFGERSQRTAGHAHVALAIHSSHFLDPGVNTSK